MPSGRHVRPQGVLRVRTSAPIRGGQVSAPRHRTTRRELAAKLDLLGWAAVHWGRELDEGRHDEQKLLAAARAYALAYETSLVGAGGGQAPSESSPCPECGATAGNAHDYSRHYP